MVHRWQMKIELITREGCALCDDTKRILDNREIEYTEKIIGTDLTRQQVFELVPGLTSGTMLPLVLVDGTWIGGRTEIVRYINTENVT